jgi:hypothetical protein
MKKAEPLFFGQAPDFLGKRGFLGKAGIRQSSWRESWFIRETEVDWS